MPDPQYVSVNNLAVRHYAELGRARRPATFDREVDLPRTLAPTAEGTPALEVRSWNGPDASQIAITLSLLQEHQRRPPGGGRADELQRRRLGAAARRRRQQPLHRASARAATSATAPTCCFEGHPLRGARGAVGQGRTSAAGAGFSTTATRDEARLLALRAAGRLVRARQPDRARADRAGRAAAAADLRLRVLPGRRARRGRAVHRAAQRRDRGASGRRPGARRRRRCAAVLAPPPPPPPAARPPQARCAVDTTAPRATVAAARPAARPRRVVVRIGCLDEACRVDDLGHRDRAAARPRQGQDLPAGGGHDGRSRQGARATVRLALSPAHARRDPPRAARRPARRRQAACRRHRRRGQPPDADAAVPAAALTALLTSGGSPVACTDGRAPGRRPELAPAPRTMTATPAKGSAWPLLAATAALLARARARLPARRLAARRRDRRARRRRRARALAHAGARRRRRARAARARAGARGHPLPGGDHDGGGGLRLRLRARPRADDAQLVSHGAARLRARARPRPAGHAPRHRRQAPGRRRALRRARRRDRADRGALPAAHPVQRHVLRGRHHRRRAAALRLDDARRHRAVLRRRHVPRQPAADPQPDATGACGRSSRRCWRCCSSRTGSCPAPATDGRPATGASTLRSASSARREPSCACGCAASA